MTLTDLGSEGIRCPVRWISTLSDQQRPTKAAHSSGSMDPWAAKIMESDFGVLRLRRFLQPFDQAGQVAVALVVQDATKDAAGLKSKAEFDGELKRLLG